MRGAKVVSLSLSAALVAGMAGLTACGNDTGNNNVKTQSLRGPNQLNTNSLPQNRMFTRSTNGESNRIQSMRYSPALSHAVSRINGVQSAHVVVTDRDAYVAVTRQGNLNTTRNHNNYNVNTSNNGLSGYNGTSMRGLSTNSIGMNNNGMMNNRTSSSGTMNTRTMNSATTRGITSGSASNGPINSGFLNHGAAMNKGVSSNGVRSNSGVVANTTGVEGNTFGSNTSGMYPNGVVTNNGMLNNSGLPSHYSNSSFTGMNTGAGNAGTYGTSGGNGTFSTHGGSGMNGNGAAYGTGGMNGSRTYSPFSTDTNTSGTGTINGSSTMGTQLSGRVTDGIPNQLKVDITNAVKQASPHIRNVYVSEDEDFVTQMGSFGDQNRGGVLNQITTDFETLINRIFPGRTGTMTGPNGYAPTTPNQINTDGYRGGFTTNGNGGGVTR